MNTINLVAVLFLFTSAICTPTVLAGDIHEAAEKGDLARVKVLLQADPSLLNAEGHDFTTPLHWAAARGHRELAEWLLSKKPKLEAADRYGMTPLLTAAQNGQNALVELLIKHGANVEAQDKSGKSSLHWAAAVGP